MFYGGSIATWCKFPDGGHDLHALQMVTENHSLTRFHNDAQESFEGFYLNEVETAYVIAYTKIVLVLLQSRSYELPF